MGTLVENISGGGSVGVAVSVVELDEGAEVVSPPVLFCCCWGSSLLVGNDVACGWDVAAAGFELSPGRLEPAVAVSCGTLDESVGVVVGPSEPPLLLVGSIAAVVSPPKLLLGASLIAAGEEEEEELLGPTVVSIVAFGREVIEGGADVDVAVVGLELALLVLL